MKISAFKNDCSAGNKYAYPLVIHKVGRDYLADIIDFDVSTEGHSIPEVISTARSLLKTLCTGMMEKGKEVPSPFSCNSFDMSGLFTFVDVDLTVEK